MIRVARGASSPCTVMLHASDVDALYHPPGHSRPASRSPLTVSRLPTLVPTPAPGCGSLTPPASPRPTSSSAT